MSLRRSFLKLIYPAVMKAGAMLQRDRPVLNKESISPKMPFYALTAENNLGETLLFGRWKGKKILVVNTASDCGFTHQYAALEKLQEKAAGLVQVLAFPSNDFGAQEKGSDEEIASFCSMNYGIRFPVMKKSRVLPGPGQHPVFAWLTQSSQNGWNDKPPVWNFSKYLLDEEGRLIAVFGPQADPLGNPLLNLITNL